MMCGFFFVIWIKWNIVIFMNVNVNFFFFKYRFEVNFFVSNYFMIYKDICRCI